MRFAVFVSAASASSLTPVEQVINMMAGLQKKIEEEGKNEATLYEKFACFCKDKTDEKSTDITEGAARVGELTGELSQLESDRNTTNTNIAQNEADIKSETETLDTENEEWDATVKVYERDIADLREGKRQIDDALAYLKRARDEIKGEAFLQKFKAAVAVADAVGFNTKKAQSAVTMVQSGNFHGDHIIEIVEELDQDFVDSIEAHESEHLQAKHTHQDVQQTQKGLLDALQVTLGDNKKQLASLNENIAETMKELTLTQANLYDDQNYLKDLTDKCEAKAKAWDQRAAMRSSELGTISEAIAIVKGTVAEKAEATSQSGHGQRVLLLADREDENEASEKVPQHSNTMKLALAEMHKRSAALLQQVQKQKHAESAQSATPTDFLQMSMVTRRLRGVEDETRQRLMSLFSQKAAKLKSQVLAEVAMHVAGDPFAKIKTLIQNMIERLLEEAGGDAEHEGWCNTELKKTKQKRDYQEENVESDTQTIHKLEGRRDTLEEQEAQLTKEIHELNDALSQANATRVQEHEDNEEAVDEATEGNTAVEKAIDILTKFYKKAAKAEVELVQQSPDEDAPDTGFDGAYKGGQEENGGILGMLEVISSDFERTIKETTKAENEAQRQFTEFKKQSLSSLAKKNAALEQTQTDLSETNQELADTVEDLEEQQTGLNNAVLEWEKLRPACVELGATSYEDRKAAREDEIESLKQALCILADPAGAANC
mmetsp:Transcript_42996/g.103630  ORF Transcript_42996/g.103630 Transcript_42996/m.103630 type:complete len:718 (+) Transcript_42996:71-2224(+)